MGITAFSWLSALEKNLDHVNSLQSCLVIHLSTTKTHFIHSHVVKRGPRPHTDPWLDADLISAKESQCFSPLPKNPPRRITHFITLISTLIWSTLIIVIVLNVLESIMYSVRKITEGPEVPAPCPRTTRGAGKHRIRGINHD